jgi:putative endonuclease
MNTTSLGQQAENAVAAQLKSEGYKVLVRNWRRRSCEIDIVASKDKVIYFVEVKYRSSQAQGDGLEYITLAKKRQFNFAARMWLSENGWEGDWRLLAASVRYDGTGLSVETVLEV